MSLSTLHNRLDVKDQRPPIDFPPAAPDQKIAAGIQHVFQMATDPTLVLPMVLAAPVFHLGKTATLRGMLNMGETWWNRGRIAQGLSAGMGFIGETTFFSLAGRGLSHLIKGPVAWDVNSLAQDWWRAGATLGLLKAAGFLGRQGTLAWRGLSEDSAHLWSRADHRAIFWGSQVSGYLGLVGSHHLETALGWRPRSEDDHPWLEALGTHIALGIGGLGGRYLMGQPFAAFERQLSLQATSQKRHGQTPLDFGELPAPALAGPAYPRTPLRPGFKPLEPGAHIQKMSQLEDDTVLPRPEPAAPGEAPAESGPPETAQPQSIRGVRRRMAETMDQSREVPRANINTDVDIHRWEERTHATTRLMQAIVYATGHVPKLNSWYRHGDQPTLEIREAVDLGVAVDTPDGLMVGTLQDIGTLKGTEMRAQLDQLLRKIQTGEIQAADLTGNTITLSNIGSIGGRYADPVVVPPTVAIVAAGRSSEQVVAHEGQPAVHRVMPLSLSFDHRAIDGAEATRFLEAMRADLERPESAMVTKPKSARQGLPTERPVAKDPAVPGTDRKTEEIPVEAGRNLSTQGEFKMEFPHIGEGVTKGELVTWLVKEGDRVQNDQDIAEVMTDKATVTIPSPVDGVVKSLKFKEGDMIEVGEIFIVLEKEGTQEAPRKKPTNGSPSNGSRARHTEYAPPGPPKRTGGETDRPVLEEAPPTESAPTLRAIPQTRKELALAPRSPVPGITLPPLPGKIHTAPQTAERPLPQFEILKGAGHPRPPQSLGDGEAVLAYLTAQSSLSSPDKIRYTQFVLDRFPPYAEILNPFILAPDVRRLETALKHFVDRVSDEAGFAETLKKAGWVSKGVSASQVLGHDLLIGMRRSLSDAAYFLDRLGQLEGAQDPVFRALADAKDPNRLQPQTNYDLSRLTALREKYPELTDEALRFAYGHAVAQRVLTEKLFRIKAATGQQLPFVVSDAGHEVQGTAAALALKHSVNREAFAISPHYRSGTLVGMWSRLHGSGNYFKQYLQQQLSRITDPWSKGRETASHFRDQRYQILPGQSEVGRNLQKGAGYARGLQQKGYQDGLVYAEMGDGSMALSDLHEAMVIANKMGVDGKKLPLMVAVVDNQMAISVEPSSGRALEDMQAYAKAHGINFATCDGNDFLSVYETYREAARITREQQRPMIIWVQNLPRLNNHSSAAAFEFDFNQKDPLLDLGAGLVAEGILPGSQIMRLKGPPGPGGFFGNHHMGEIGEQAKKRMDDLWSRVEAEPHPTLEQTLEDVRLEFPRVVEAPYENRPTHTIINGAIRAALRDIMSENPLTWVNGQDTAMKGGVMQATAGLWEFLAGQAGPWESIRPADMTFGELLSGKQMVTDAPINEPAIMSSAIGFALHEGAVAFPEIQFGDYALSGYHWMVYAGNLLWRSGGTHKINWNLRLPVEPGIYGAVYHSTPLEGLMASIPGLTFVSPSTSRDAYGLIRSAAEYAGPVVIFEPKALYRSALGDAFPNEPQLSPEGAEAYLKWIATARGIPDIPKDFRVPLGKAAVRREGRDLTIVTWGLAHAETLKVMDQMVQQGIDVEVIDLRTLVPPDMETVKASVEKTGRLLIAHQDRVFASLGREIQGQVQEAFPGRYLPIHVLGMQPVPGIPQSKPMEDAVRVKGSDILQAALKLMGKNNPKTPWGLQSSPLLGHSGLGVKLSLTKGPKKS